MSGTAARWVNVLAAACRVDCSYGRGMEWVELEPREMAAFDSRGVCMVAVAQLGAGSESRVHVASVGPSGVLGRHPTRSWQLFHVLSGTGWVSGGDEVREPISAGQAVLWSPGEEHESGSDAGMVVLIVQSSQPLDCAQ